MAAVAGGEGGNGGFGGGLPLEAWFFEMPIVTRCWTTATVLTGVLVQCGVLNPFQLFYSWRAVYHKGQVSHVDFCNKCKHSTDIDISTGASSPHSFITAHFP